MRLKESLDTLPQLSIRPALAVEKGGPVRGRLFNGCEEHGLDTFRITGHGWPLLR